LRNTNAVQSFRDEVAGRRVSNLGSGFKTLDSQLDRDVQAGRRRAGAVRLLVDPVTVVLGGSPAGPGRAAWRAPSLWCVAHEPGSSGFSLFFGYPP